ncbi:MAG: N-acetylglucosamine-6-phosphate deacetylase [Candidatus Bipolaricaulaceae bacterium]
MELGQPGDEFYARIVKLAVGGPEVERLRIRGGRLVCPEKGNIAPSEVLLGDGRILAVSAEVQAWGASELDVQGLFIAPGFIDLQVNGGAGYNFQNATPKDIAKILELHLAHGTTGLLPTTITAPIPEIRCTMARLREINHPAVLGIHLEGPFISKKRRGAHNPKHILDPSLEEFHKLMEGYVDFIKIFTLAPELPGADLLLNAIAKIGVISALGHSDANYLQAKQALEQGVRLFTHLGNAMTGLHHREPGAVGAALDSDAYVELICDGVHLHPAFVRLVAKVKGYDRICLVTDAISAAGLPDGEYILAGLPTFVRGGVPRLSDGTLAGSTLTMDRAVKNFMEFTGCSLPEAVRCATLNPARLLGLDRRKGSLAVGKDADLVIFDEDLTVHYTILAGKIVYARMDWDEKTEAEE